MEKAKAGVGLGTAIGLVVPVVGPVVGGLIGGKEIYNITYYHYSHPLSPTLICSHSIQLTLGIFAD